MRRGHLNDLGRGNHMRKEPLPLLPEKYVPASLAKRAGARVIDVLVVLTWVWALSIAHILFYIPRYAAANPVGPWGNSFLFVASFVGFYLVYEAVFLSFTGVTPGKDLLNLRVVDYQSLEPLSTAQALKRAAPITVIWLIPYWWLAGLLNVALGLSTLSPGKPRSGWHDRFAKTKVVFYDATLAPGVDTEDARAERMMDFMPRFTNPIQVLPGQMLNYPTTPMGSEKDAKDSSTFE